MSRDIRDIVHIGKTIININTIHTADNNGQNGNLPSPNEGGSVAMQSNMTPLECPYCGMTDSKWLHSADGKHVWCGNCGQWGINPISTAQSHGNASADDEADFRNPRLNEINPEPNPHSDPYYPQFDSGTNEKEDEQRQKGNTEVPPTPIRFTPYRPKITTRAEGQHLSEQLNPTLNPNPQPSSTVVRPVPGNDTYNSNNRTNRSEIIRFGAYPQSEVKDNSLKSTLCSLAKDKEGWKSYRYYINGKASDFMVYNDVGYRGEKYRGVFFTSYRPTICTINRGRSAHQADNGYMQNIIYWFKYEPIQWKKLEEKNGEAFLFADKILDSQHYYHYHTSHSGWTCYALSDIRKWLNGTFYNMAFTGEEQQLIKKTRVNNYGLWNQEDTVFLLSLQEATTSSFGFTNAMSCQKQGTEYAKCQGLGVIRNNNSGNSFWWLRTHEWENYGNDRPKGVVLPDSVNALYTYYGVCPAIKIWRSGRA